MSRRRILMMYRLDTSAREEGGSVVGGKGNVLELAVLGSLHETPLHGYELRKRLNSLLGMFRAFSYGSLYPCLRQLLNDGLIAEEEPPAAEAAVPLAGRRSKIVYKLTAEGKERLQELLTQAGPSTWEDESFGIHFAFFRHTEAEVRLRILEGRRSRLEERLESVRTALARTRERLDSYTLELQRHGLESVEREVRWLNELIATERRAEARSVEATAPGAAEGDRSRDGRTDDRTDGSPAGPDDGPRQARPDTDEPGRPEDGTDTGGRPATGRTGEK
jgi:DNA-binding PadR family transcriptional regulator